MSLSSWTDQNDLQGVMTVMQVRCARAKGLAPQDLTVGIDPPLRTQRNTPDYIQPAAPFCWRQQQMLPQHLCSLRPSLARL